MPSEQKLREIFKINLNNLFETRRDLQQSDLATYMGVSNTTVSNWVNGYKMPRMDKIDKICEFFDVPRSNLLDKKQTTDLTTREERQIESDLEDMLHSMSSAAYEGENDFEDLEAFKATIKSAMIQAKKIAKKKYTPKKYKKD